MATAIYFSWWITTGAYHLYGKNGFSSGKRKSNRIFHRTFFGQKKEPPEVFCFSRLYRDVWKITAPMHLDEIHGLSGGKWNGTVLSTRKFSNAMTCWTLIPSHWKKNVLFHFMENSRQREISRILIRINFETEKIKFMRNKLTFSCSTFLMRSSSSSWCFLASISIWAITFGLDFHTSRLISIIWLQ